MWSLKVGAVLAALLPVAVAAPASAAGVPPAVSVDASPHYVVGTPFHTAYEDDGGGPYLAYWDGRFEVRWTAYSAAGICRQTLTEQSYNTLGGDRDPVLGGNTVTSPVSPRARSYAFATNAFDFARGGYRFVVRATDCHGVTRTSNISDLELDITEDTMRQVHYAGGWQIARSTGRFSGALEHETTAAGATAAISVRGGAVGLTATRGPGRGRADVLVDGRRQATVDLDAASRADRVVVWESVLPPGTHTVSLRNQATPGRPTAALDLVLGRLG